MPRLSEWRAEDLELGAGVLVIVGLAGLGLILPHV